MKIQYSSFRPDNALILGTIAKLLYENNPVYDADEELVLHAVKRANHVFYNLSTEEIGEVLSDYDENQLLGFANNVKGILHELQFVEFENEDGDQLIASVFADTNHPGTDVMLTDLESGEITAIQLKATENSSAISDWMKQYPEGEILVTEEIATEMNLESTGMTNGELTVRTEDFIDRIIESSEQDAFWDYVPALSAVSVAIAGYGLFVRYHRNEIDFSTFKNRFLLITGGKILKFTTIAMLMLIPVVNVLTGATVLFMALNSLIPKR